MGHGIPLRAPGKPPSPPTSTRDYGTRNNPKIYAILGPQAHPGPPRCNPREYYASQGQNTWAHKVSPSQGAPALVYLVKKGWPPPQGHCRNGRASTTSHWNLLLGDLLVAKLSWEKSNWSLLHQSLSRE